MNAIIDNLIKRYPDLSVSKESVRRMIEMIIETYMNGNKLFVAGNGGSCADADHIAGELIKSFKIRRHLPESEREKLQEQFGLEGEKMGSMLEPGLPCMTLHSQIGFVTAFWNDAGADYVYAQHLYSQSKPGDLLLAISTSGSSVNIYYAMMAAKLKGVKTVLLTGNKCGKCESLADVTVTVPAGEPYLVQEYHLPIYHALCLAVEEHFYGK